MERIYMKKRVGVIWLLVSMLAIGIGVLIWFRLPYNPKASFVLLMGYSVTFYRFLVVMVISLSMIIMFTAVFLMRKKRSRFCKVRYGIEIGLFGLLFAICLGYTVSHMSSFHKTPWAVSPDGKHAIYQDGGDRDFFGHTSGYMHYAMDLDTHSYGRAFYTFIADDIPEIVWQEDGVLVKFECPVSDNEFNEGDDVAPESSTTCLFRWEKTEEGYFFQFMDE